MKQVKYPFSNLKKHHYCYMELLYNFLKTMYEFRFYLKGEETKIIIEIHDVHPSPIYDPSNFDAQYKVVSQYDGSYVNITSYDFFKTFFTYLPDIVPYLEFELYSFDKEPFKSFDLRFQYNSEFINKGEYSF
jgi:hypothetical protein